MCISQLPLYNKSSQTHRHIKAIISLRLTCLLVGLGLWELNLPPGGFSSGLLWSLLLFWDKQDTGNIFFSWQFSKCKQASSTRWRHTRQSEITVYYRGSQGEKCNCWSDHLHSQQKRETSTFMILPHSLSRLSLVLCSSEPSLENGVTFGGLSMTSQDSPVRTCLLVTLTLFPSDPWLSHVDS